MKKETKEKNTKDAVQKMKIVLSPRITEKAAKMSEQNAYTFMVDTSATKSEIIKEIVKRYKVTPIKVNTTKISKKIRFIRGNWGTKGGGKKAVVFLKKGDSIAIA